MSACDRILELLGRDDLYEHAPDQLDPLRLDAAREVFERLRPHIPVLDRRATETGTDSIDSLQDIVPLLFAHTTYKSYPQSFVDKGQWDRMTQWLDTLSGVDLSGVDVTGVSDVDGWIDAIADAGFTMFTSSGTGGKVSFFVNAPEDMDIVIDVANRLTAFPRVSQVRERRMYRFSATEGPNKGVVVHNYQAQQWASADKIHELAPGRLRIADMQRAGQLRRAIANGTATPSQIAEAENAAAAQSDNSRINAFIDDLLDHRHEPLFVGAWWGQQWAIYQRAKERGIPDGEFHPDTIIGTGGGTKGLNLPDDFEKQIMDFYGDVHSTRPYGMTEVTTPCHRCEVDRYHIPPNLILLVLDRPGEIVLNRDEGVVEGRVAFLDLSLRGRWGGVISGDRAVVDFSACPCGRPGPSIVEVGRYTDLPGDDKIECAATIDAYVRSALQS